VDFYCAELRLAVEVDGPVHDGHCIQDRERDDDLASLGVWVVRLHNAEVLGQLEAAAAYLARCCERAAKQRGLLPSPASR
jgi:ATP-dependent DNA helicase RecQ